MRHTVKASDNARRGNRSKLLCELMGSAGRGSAGALLKDSGVGFCPFSRKWRQCTQGPRKSWPHPSHTRGRATTGPLLQMYFKSKVSPRQALLPFHSDPAPQTTSSVCCERARAQITHTLSSRALEHPPAAGLVQGPLTRATRLAPHLEA